MTESIINFEQRKKQHLEYALNPAHQTGHHSLLGQIQLIHEALPDLNLAEVSITSSLFNQSIKTPFFVSSMTSGHENAIAFNQLIANICAERGWAMGIGSQRRQLLDNNAQQEWIDLRLAAPNTVLFGNLGLAQLIGLPISAIETMVEKLQASAMIIHTNPLQECLQPEGTPNFKGGFTALEQLCKTLSVPVILKETGCGFSKNTLERLNNIGLAVVDISGLGGTHWGRIEGQRAQDPLLINAAQTFADWGIDTVTALLYGRELTPSYELWASGGVRSGLDAAKLLALGAQHIGFAKPILTAALQGSEALHQLMEQYEYELKMALFLTGSQNISELQERATWQYSRT